MFIVRSLLIHNNGFGLWHIKESYLPDYRKSMALPDMSGERSYLKALSSSSSGATNSLPHPQRTIRNHMQNQSASRFFFIKQNIIITIYTVERDEGSLCFGFCSRPLEPNRITHITEPRAQSLQKCGLPENSQLHQVWDLSYIPWCFGIVWFHHLSPTSPNFYQTRQEAGTLYSVCTVALSKTSLFSFFANVSGKGINMLCAKWITAN